MTLVRDQIDAEERKKVELSGSSSVEDLLESEGIEPEEVLVSRDGNILSGRHDLSDGDIIEVRDVIAGG